MISDHSLPQTYPMSMDPNFVAALQGLIPFLGQLTANTTLPTLPAPPAAPTAPPIGSYVSNRPQVIPSSLQGHPNRDTSLSAPNPLQPILGSASLGVSMAANSNRPRRRNQSSSGSVAALSRSQISEANNGRQHAMHDHFPATQSLVRRNGRPRGAAQALPTLPPVPTSPESVVDVDPLSGERYINIDVHVTPPTDVPNTPLHFIQYLYTSHLAWLETHDLRFLYRLPETTTIVALIATVVAAMESSPTRWKFNRGQSSLAYHLRPHESLPLQLLGLVNKGIPRSHNGPIFLRRQPPSLDHTLRTLLDDRSIFAKPKVTIRGSRMIVQLVVARSGITCIADPDTPASGHPRRHSCLSTIFHEFFSIAHEDPEGSDWSPPTCDSGGESSDDESEEMELEQALLASDIENLPSTPTPGPSTRGAVTRPHARSPLQPAMEVQAPAADTSPSVPPTVSSISQATSGSSAAQASHFHDYAFIPPPVFVYPKVRDDDLWAVEWVPQPAKYEGLFDRADLAKSIFETACSGARPRELIVEGTSIAECVDNLLALILVSARSGDYTAILSPDRTFQLLRPDDGGIVSFGVGVEREVWYTAFRCFTDSEGAWFLPRFDNRCSIATTMSHSVPGLGDARLEQLAVLGCIIGVLLIFGIAPEPLSPAVIQFAVNGCDLSSLTREFVREWHPDLVALLDRWDEIGPGGNVIPFQPFFASFMDLQVSVLRLRSPAQHRALKNEMAYYALIGSQLPSHIDLATVFRASQLPCSNGFNFHQAIGSFPGGSATYLSQTWTSIIHNFDSLRPHLLIRTIAPDVLASIPGAATSSIPVASLDLRLILEAFLSADGIPCPSLLTDEDKGQFSELIPWDKIDSPAFRPMILCWSATGSPHVESEDTHRLEISFAAPNDTSYHGSTAKRSQYMSAGKIAFRTCFRSARIPVSYLLKLSSASYPAQDEAGNDIEPFTLEQAIHHWLLMEILGGVGDHTMA
ncbi:hypothetical protein C8R46DRAFT_1223166 [Mycena filopes]|nr:hypothetical protein C8R46DRAFT_1223166 [Mycena filopes]